MEEDPEAKLDKSTARWERDLSPGTFKEIPGLSEKEVVSIMYKKEISW